MRAEDQAAPGPTTLVVPCYNEAERLRPAEFLAAVERFPWLRLLLTDDGSRDPTRRVLQDLADKAPGRIEVLGLDVNGGKAEAVRRGILRALEGDSDFVGYWDADLSTPFDAVPAFMSVFRRRPEVVLVLGSRVRMMGREIRRTPGRHYVGRVFATGASIVLRLPVYDTQCGAKILRVEDGVADLFAKPFRTRWIFDVELMARFLDAPRHQVPGQLPPEARIYELPLQSWLDEPGSKVRTMDGVRAALDLVRIYFIRRRA